MSKVLIALAFLVIAVPASADTVIIRAFIDGESNLIIQGDGIVWHHSTFAVPGHWPSDNDFATSINGVEWVPTWPAPGRNNSCDCFSSSITGLAPFSSEMLDLGIHSVVGRGPVTLATLPDRANGFKGEVVFDDSNFPGAAWYQVELSYSTAPVPLPGSACLLSAALASLVLGRRRL